jgi:hypothetical protein
MLVPTCPHLLACVQGPVQPHCRPGREPLRLGPVSTADRSRSHTLLTGCLTSADLGDHDSTSMTWNVSLAAGTQVLVSIEDAHTNEGWTQAVRTPLLSFQDSYSLLHRSPSVTAPTSPASPRLSSLSPRPPAPIPLPLSSSRRESDVSLLLELSQSNTSAVLPRLPPSRTLVRVLLNRLPPRLARPARVSLAAPAVRLASPPAARSPSAVLSSRRSPCSKRIPTAIYPDHTTG